MKLLIISVLLILTCCSTNSVQIYKQTEQFIDIEVSKENFWFTCDETDHKEKKSFMSFYTIEDDTVHLLIFRRIIDTKRCLKVYDKYKKIITKTSKIRLVGINLAKKEKNYLQDQNVPDKFKKAEYLTTWYFVRFHTGNTCESYFTEDCEPQNYWGGLFLHN